MKEKSSNLIVIFTALISVTLMVVELNPHSPYGARHLLPLIYITIYK